MSAQSLLTYRPKADQAISDLQNHGDFQKQQLCSIVAGTLWPYLEAGRAWRRPSLRKKERKKEDRQVVQCSCCSRSLAELNPLAPSLPATFRPSEIGDILIFYSGGVGRVLRPLPPSFLPGGLPACPFPFPSPSTRG